MGIKENRSHASGKEGQGYTKDKRCVVGEGKGQMEGCEDRIAQELQSLGKLLCPSVVSSNTTTPRM